jgi:hypothetical protein
VRSGQIWRTQVREEQPRRSRTGPYRVDDALRQFVGTLIKAGEPRLVGRSALAGSPVGDLSGIEPERTLYPASVMYVCASANSRWLSPTRQRAKAMADLLTPFFASSCARSTDGCMSSSDRPVGRMRISAAGAMRRVAAVELGGASMISRSNYQQACRAWSIVRKRSTGMTGSIWFCRRRACQLKLVPWDMSRSAIFTIQPALAYSRYEAGEGGLRDSSFFANYRDNNHEGRNSGRTGKRNDYLTE